MMKMLPSHVLLMSIVLAVLIASAGCEKATQEPSTSAPAAAAPRAASTAVPSAAAPLTSFAQELSSPIRTITIRTGSTYTLPITVKNTGPLPWVGAGAGPGIVDAGYRWLDSKGQVLPIEGNRAALNRPSVQPGESASLQLLVASPPQPGNYTLWVSMVQEGVDWFFLRGAKPLAVPATIK